jgi:general secretion pathway protein J
MRRVREVVALRRALRPPSRSGARAGFGLLEAILALAIAGLVLAAVTEIAGRTLRSWNAGFGTTAAVERTDVALGRIAADLASALPVRLVTADDPAILFVGDGRGMAFTAVTPLDRSHDGIAVVEIGVETTSGGAALTRRLRRGRDVALRDGDRVVLLSGPLDLAFA